MKFVVGNEELLSIFMVLTEFYTILLGAKLHINTITTNNTTPDCVICVQKFLKHYKTREGNLKAKTTGPINILRVHSIGTVTMSLRPGILSILLFNKPCHIGSHTPL